MHLGVHSETAIYFTVHKCYNLILFVIFFFFFLGGVGGVITKKNEIKKNKRNEYSSDSPSKGEGGQTDIIDKANEKQSQKRSLS